MSPIKQVSRRQVLRKTSEMLGTFLLVRFATHSRPAIAGNASKASLHYQDHPKEGEMCVDCSSYRRNPDPDSTTGLCKVVAGDIDPKGWCMAFSRR